MSHSVIETVHLDIQAKLTDRVLKSFSRLIFRFPLLYLLLRSMSHQKLIKLLASFYGAYSPVLIEKESVSGVQYKTFTGIQITRQHKTVSLKDKTQIL